MGSSFKVVFGEKCTYKSHKQCTGPTVLITNIDTNPNLAVSKLSLSDHLESVSFSTSTFGV